MSIQNMIDIYVEKLHLLLTLQDAGYNDIQEYLNFIYAEKLVVKYKGIKSPELSNKEWLILGDIMRDMSCETKT